MQDVLDQNSCDVILHLMTNYIDYHNSYLYGKTTDCVVFEIRFASIERVKISIPSWDSEASADFVARTRICTIPEECFQFHNIPVVTEDSIPEFWDQVYDLDPRYTGLVMVSPVGFNSDKSKAILYGQWNRGARLHGHYFELLKESTEWSIRKATGVFDG